MTKYKAEDIDKKSIEGEDSLGTKKNKEGEEISIEMIDHLPVGDIEFEGEESTPVPDRSEDTPTEKINDEVEKWKDAALRRLAELENFRKRVEKEKETLRAVTICEIGKLLAPMMDDVERACGYQFKENDSSIQQALSLLKSKMEKVFSSLGIEPIVPLGEQFDPAIHEAVMTDPRSDIQPNQVTEVLLTGYRVGRRLIRAASVKVSSKKTEE